MRKSCDCFLCRKAQDERSEGGAGITEAERQKIVHEGHEAVAKILEFIESIVSDVGGYYGV